MWIVQCLTRSAGAEGKEMQKKNQFKPHFNHICTMAFALGQFYDSLTDTFGLGIENY